ncbi:WhiB family transcriptional regulator [Streptomyces sp. NBC_00443]|uniref:WhiB family transcriptional regulator n=1 Tax=Streptomyces sp. NBC_00443 TaxID=2975743 RepID=UPI002E238F93
MTENSVFRRRPNHAPDTLARPDHWGKYAPCRRAPREIFFPEDFAGAEAVLVAEEAKGYCRQCPALDDCLAEAMQRPERFGVWGGTTAPERRALARRQREEAKRAEAQVVTEAA